MNKKISELPELLATTDADMLEIVNAGVSKRVNVENLLASAKALAITGTPIADATGHSILESECITAFNKLGLPYTADAVFYVKPDGIGALFSVFYSHEGATSQANHGPFYYTQKGQATHPVPTTDLTIGSIRLWHNDPSSGQCIMDMEAVEGGVNHIARSSLTFKVNGIASTMQLVHVAEQSPSFALIEQIDVTSISDVITASFTPAAGSNLLAFTDFAVTNEMFPTV